MKAKLLIALICTAMSLSAGARMSPEVTELQESWAEVKYELPKKQRKKAFEVLAEQADSVVSAEPNSAEAHIWAGIIYSTWAGESGMFSAMKRAKRAKAELERALELDPDALHGSAYTSLGALLYQLPGMMGGDDEQAEAYLRKGIELNPDGIDSNYFYAEFLADQDRYEESRQYLAHAAEAPARPGRETADQGRRQEIDALNETIEKKLR